MNSSKTYRNVTSRWAGLIATLFFFPIMFGAIPGFSHNPGAASAASQCQQRWMYVSDTWRLVPDAVSVDHDAVTPRFHIEDVYIPGSPDQNANFSGYVGVALDAGPTLMVPTQQAAHVSKPLSVKINGIQRGRHRLEITLFQGNQRLGWFLSCITIPSYTTAKRSQFNLVRGR